jgi:hydroxymethylpyrimidine pyrophosphatase-like HAD family hydrolase
MPARIPSAFRSQDLTHVDVYALSAKFVDSFPDRARPIVVVGLRTAGSYFAPLFRAHLESQGYLDVTVVTLRPKVGLGRRERERLRESVRRGAMAVIIDEPVYSASTFARALTCLEGAGFLAKDITALFPVHPHRRNWRSTATGLALSNVRVLTLEPEEWHKASLLEPEPVRKLLSEYFGTGQVRVRPMDAAAAALLAGQEPGFHCRLKRLYEVDVPGSESRRQIILAKSAGWGWLAYHAYLAGVRLGQSVPRVLGLRDGILFMEWIEEKKAEESDGRDRLVEAGSSYIALRARALALGSDPTPLMTRNSRHRGMEELAAVLSGAYNSKITSALKRSRLERRLSSLVCDRPALIDGRMRPVEWVECDQRLVKTDFEHHGMGKHQLNVTDPAYDLAEAILYWRLSAGEEKDFLEAYVRQSGDGNVFRRLFLSKLLAGSWAVARAVDGLKDPAEVARHPLYHERYRTAWDFLTNHTTRFCASLARRPSAGRWSSPLVALDVDGVLDKQIFGFPSSTGAGIAAVSLLASHGVAVAVNTARSAEQVKEYCRAYGFVGGVAEYGAFVWDAVNDRELVTLSNESGMQLARMRNALQELPGVFIDGSYRHLVKAYTFARGTTVPLPEMQVRTLMARLGLDRLRLHQTFSDSTVTAVDVDKGTGLSSLLALTGCSGIETIAIGDTEPDLAMFRVASRSFAPAQISCPEPARMLGCRIAKNSWQPGLLEIARQIVHPDGRTCSDCASRLPPNGPWDALVVELLDTADRNPLGRLISSLFDPLSLGAFRK